MTAVGGRQYSRREFLRVGAAAGLAATLPRAAPGAAQSAATFRLSAQRTSVSLVGHDYPATAVWSYDGQVPGSEIRIRRGERLRVFLDNALEQPTTVHFHGVRLPNAMDGVPYLTQDPVAPGEVFAYEFEPPDAGTFWYHPHFNSAEQVGRGLYGALIVEEPEPIAIDRELVWILDDWRLTRGAGISEPFGSGHDISHGGRLGNTVTINGQVPGDQVVRSGERLRLRLINAANARHFALQFERLQPWIIAIDGQPVEPHVPADELVVLAPAMRIDLMLDVAPEPGNRTRVIDTFYRDAYVLTHLAVDDATPLRDRQSADPVRLPPNPLPEPDLGHAERFEVDFAGGAMGRMRGALLDGQWTDIRTMARRGVVWAINGAVATGNVLEPLLTLRRGQSCVLAMRNDTAFFHPIHLHGHHFRVLHRNQAPTRYREWQDTVLMGPGEHVDVAFVADNPGDWMFHCHIPEHMDAGMVGVIRIA